MAPVLDEMGQMVIDPMTGAPQLEQQSSVKVLEDNATRLVAALG